jgi:hypothetical protein
MKFHAGEIVKYGKYKVTIKAIYRYRVNPGTYLGILIEYCEPFLGHSGAINKDDIEVIEGSLPTDGRNFYYFVSEADLKEVKKSIAEKLKEIIKKCE